MIPEISAGRPTNKPRKQKMKNAIIFRVPRGWPESALALSDALSGMKFVPCRPADAEAVGLVPPAEHAYGLAHRVDGCIMLTLQTETKILPKSVILRAVRDRAEEIEKEEGRKVGRKEMSEMAITVCARLLPQAFSKFSRFSAYLYPSRSLMVVDTTSPARAVEFAETLRRVAPDNDIKPFRTAQSPANGMTQWLRGGIPDDFAVNDEVDLVRDDDERPTVKYQRHSLDGQDVTGHLNDGKRPTRIALTYNDRSSFVLTDKLHIKRFTLPDVVALEVGEQETKEDRFDAEMALRSGEMLRVVEAIEEALGGPAIDSEGSAK